jgi:Zn-dependent M28 family amino/carboxypeptidase
MSTLAFLLLLALCLGACRRHAPPPLPAQIAPSSFLGEKALAEARAFVALGPRVAGSPGAKAAADYLYKRLEDLGLDPSIDVFSDRTPEGDKIFRNISAVLRGTGTGIVVVASHIDTKAGIADTFAGANDSGSSTAVLLALADVLKSNPPLRCTVVLAFLDGEECLRDYGPGDGLHGSRRLLRRMQSRGEAGNVTAFVLLDMIGDRHLSVTIPSNSTPSLVSRAFEAARAEGRRLRFSLSRNAILDDHVPFLEAGIPAVDLIDFEYGTAPGRNDYWHTPQDTIDKLSAESLEIIGRVTVRMLNSL